MADATTSLSTPIGATDPLAEIIWSRDAHVEIVQGTWFQDNGMQARDTGGKDAHRRRPGVPIIVKDEFGKVPGDRLFMRLRKQLTDTPRTSTATYSDNSMLGNEETLDYYDLEVKLAMLKHAVGTNSPDLYGHRSSIDIEGDAEEALQTWMTTQIEEGIGDAFYEGCPYFVQQSLSVTAAVHPNLYYANGATDPTGVSETDTLKHTEIRRIRAYCMDKPLNPIKIGSKECFAVLCSVYAANTLDADPDYKAHQASNVQSDKNPLINGAIGHYHNLFVHEYQRVRVATAGGTDPAKRERLIVLGADAIAVGFGDTPRLVQRMETDYGDRWGRGLKHVWGASRATWSDSDDDPTLNQSSAQWEVYAERDEFAS